jgi:hypothetical protein
MMSDAVGAAVRIVVATVVLLATTAPATAHSVVIIPRPRTAVDADLPMCQ